MDKITQEQLIIARSKAHVGIKEARMKCGKVLVYLQETYTTRETRPTFHKILKEAQAEFGKTLIKIQKEYENTKNMLLA